MRLDCLLLIYLTLHIKKVLNDGVPISLYIIWQLSVTPSRFLLKVRHDEQKAIDEAVAGAFAFRQLTKYPVSYTHLAKIPWHQSSVWKFRHDISPSKKE